MKSTKKPTRDYAFNCSTRYKNCAIMCICESDKKMWCIDGNTVTVKKKIAIGLQNSKYDPFEVTTETINDRLEDFYNNLPKYAFETIDTPITSNQKLEREYRKYREKMVDCIEFTNHHMQGMVYDFKINGYKIQEKVGTPRRKEFLFSFHKNNGRNNNKIQLTSYKKGDNDFYWLNCQDKKTFYVIPENVLLLKEYIDKKKKMLVINPTSIEWLKEYTFDYMNIDIERLKRMFV